MIWLAVLFGALIIGLAALLAILFGTSRGWSPHIIRRITDGSIIGMLFAVAVAGFLIAGPLGTLVGLVLVGWPVLFAIFMATA